MRGTIRKFLIIFAVVVVAAVAAVVWHVSRSGSSSIEGWIGQQLKAIVNSRLVPTLEFEDLDYEYPGTVRLKNLRLVATHGTVQVNILAAASAEVTLAEVPAHGQPIAVQAIRLNRPEVRVVYVQTDHGRVLAGFSDFVRKGAPASEPSATKPVLSDVLTIRHIEILSGLLVYDPGTEGVPPMVLDDIDLDLHVEPNEAGLYQVDTEVKRTAVAEVKVKSLLNLDTFHLSNLDLRIDAKVTRGQNQYLPPQLQKALADREVSGQLSATISGSMPMKDPELGALTANIELKDAHVAMGQNRVPVDSFTATLLMSNDQLVMQSIEMHAMQGQASASGSLGLSGEKPLKLDLALRGIKLEQSLRLGDRYAGAMDADLHADVPLGTLLATIDREPGIAPLPVHWGQGRIELTEGKLDRVPVLGRLMEKLRETAGVITGENGKKDRLKLLWKFTGPYVDFEEITYVGGMIAVRGKGTMDVHGELNLRLNGGPLEKMQSMLGPIGSIWGKLSDAVASYEVTGPVDDPAVRLTVGR